MNKLKLNQALAATFLSDKVSISTLHEHVSKARKLRCFDGTTLPPPYPPINNVNVDLELMADVSSFEDQSPSTSCASGASSTTGASGASSRATLKVRKTVFQASTERIKKKERKKENEELYKNACKEATSLFSTRDSGESLRTLVFRLNEKYNLNVAGRQRLTKTTISRLVQQGMAGQSPVKRGPATKIPLVFLQLLAAHVEVCQVGTGELNSKELKRLISASISGSSFESKFTVSAVWKRLREKFPESTQATKKLSIEDARAEWTTHSNLQDWFDIAKKDLIKSGLVVEKETVERGSVLSELDFRSDEVKRRIINMDETHHDLSIVGDKSGPRAITYHNPALQRAGKRAVKSSRHVTGVYASNAAGEALPPMYIYDSSAKSSANFQVKTEWLEGLPTVTGKYGCPTLQEYSSFFAVRTKGSMDDSLLNSYIEQIVIPLFPNMHGTAEFDEQNGKLIRGPVILKLDAGPGRMVASEESVSAKQALRERGLLLLFGLPNATSVNQEMDDLYGPFKTATYARAERLVSEKIKDRGAKRKQGLTFPAVISLGFADLPTVVNGTEGNGIMDKPFSRFFTKEKILHSWSNIGLVPFTRASLKNKKVRNEIGDNSESADVLRNLQTRYDSLVRQAEEAGFNPGIFDAEIPTAQQIVRPETEDEQVKQLLDEKGAFSASAQWRICGTRIGNSAVTLRAQKELLRIELEKAAGIEKKKSEEKAKKLAKARAALYKYHMNVHSLNDKDWGDLLRWVLPAAGVDFLVKDFKKKEAIKAKLDSLPQAWESYIPPGENNVVDAV